MRCSKCNGCLAWNFEEWFCINCGARPENIPLPEPYVSPRFIGTTHCRLCGEPRCKYSTLCRGCAIGEGFAKARNRG